MRYCRRTFFNVLFQPKRIGKNIKKFKYKRHTYQKKFHLTDRRQSSTPRMSILARYHMVKRFKVFEGVIRRTTSKFVWRARLNVS